MRVTLLSVALILLSLPTHAANWCVAGESMSVIGDWPSKADALLPDEELTNFAVLGAFAYQWDPAPEQLIPDHPPGTTLFNFLSGCTHIILWTSHGEMWAGHTMELTRLIITRITSRFSPHNVVLILPDTLVPVHRVRAAAQREVVRHLCLDVTCVQLDLPTDGSLTSSDGVHLNEAGGHYVAARVAYAMRNAPQGRAWIRRFFRERFNWAGSD